MFCNEISVFGPQTKSEQGLFFAELDATFREVVRCHFDNHLITGEDADAVFAHGARGVGKHFVAVLKLHPKHGVREDFGNDAFKFEEFFFCHAGLIAWNGADARGFRREMLLIVEGMPKRFANGGDDIGEHGARASDDQHIGRHAGGELDVFARSG